MSDENLNQNEDEKIETSNGEDSDDDSGLDELFQDGETEVQALERINQATKKNFKSLDDVAKSLLEADKKFSQKGMEQKTKPELSPDIYEEVLLARHPEAEYVLDELREKGGDPLKSYRESAYLQKEAKARAEVKGNLNKVSNPSNQIADEKRVTTQEQLEKVFMTNMPPGFELKK